MTTSNKIISIMRREGKYCVSRCAKDKFEIFIFKPLILLTIMTGFAAFAVVLGVILGSFGILPDINPFLSGVIAMGILFILGIIVFGVYTLIDEFSMTSKEDRIKAIQSIGRATSKVTLKVLPLLFIGTTLLGVLFNEFVLILHLNPFLAGLTLLMLGFFVVVLLRMAFFILNGAWHIGLWVNEKIDTWINTKYDPHKKSCTLLEECI